MNPWQDELCGICLKPFSERSWEKRHNIPAWHPAAGRDCHDKCCPSANCQAAYKARKPKKEQPHV